MITYNDVYEVAKNLQRVFDPATCGFFFHIQMNPLQLQEVKK